MVHSIAYHSIYFYPPLFTITKRYKGLIVILISFLSFGIIKILPSLDWHYVCLISRLPIFALGILYFCYKGNLGKLILPLLVFVVLHELSINNDLKYLEADFYSPLLLVMICIFLSRIDTRTIYKRITWIGTKSLECFIGNGMVTQFLLFEGVTRYFYYIAANIIWIAIFVWINSILPSNK